MATKPSIEFEGKDIYGVSAKAIDDFSRLEHFELEKGGERYYVSSAVGQYLGYKKGVLYKKHPDLWRRPVSAEEREKITELLGHSLPSNIYLLKKVDVDEIIRVYGNKSDSVNPHDSISNVSSYQSSNTRRKYVDEQAHVHALQVKLKMAEEQAKLDQQRLELDNKREILKIKGEIEASRARAEVYERLSNAGSRVSRPSDHSPDSDASSKNSRKAVHPNSEQKSDSVSNLVAFMNLPKQEVPIFAGNPIEYMTFIRTFEFCIESHTQDPTARLYYLVQYTAGEVKELMKSYLSLPPRRGYSEAKAMLRKQFGNAYKISTAHVDKLLAFPFIKNEDAVSLRKYGILLSSCKNTLEEIGFIEKIENVEMLRKVVSKLPYDLRKRWRVKADTITEDEEREINLDDVVSFITRASRQANHPMFGSLNVDSDTVKPKTGVKDSVVKKRFTFTTSATESGQNAQKQGEGQGTGTGFQRLCAICCENHKVEACPKFFKSSCEERVKCAKDKGLCFNCLIPKHRVLQCRKPPMCTICTKKHNTLLHLPSYSDKSNKTVKPESDVKEKVSDAKEVSNAYIKNCANKIGMPIVSVKVRAKGGKDFVQTLALLDYCSNTTFCTNQLKNSVKAPSKQAMLLLTTLDKDSALSKADVCDLEIFDMNDSVSFELKSVYARPRLPVTSKYLPSQEEVDMWPHLTGVQVPNLTGSVGLLIGNDNHMAMQPIELKRSNNRDPYAMKTPLGWVVNGPFAKSVTEQEHIANFIQTDTDCLDAQFRKFCNVEFRDSLISCEKFSQEDKCALNKMSKSCELINGHYTLDLPWRENRPFLPNNKSVAESRLHNLQRQLLCDKVKCEKYFGFMNELIDKCYAERVPESDLCRNDGLVWYLPHHSVVNTKKPDKVRVVFDCSAKFQGVSLNEKLLQGPDFTNKLSGVLLRFRQEKIAVMGDIESMFLQVRVSNNHRDALRFLWWPDEKAMINGEAQEYRMTVHLFGATSSPACSNYALLKTAEENQDSFDAEVVTTVKKNFYVDDCLKSFDSVENAVNHANQLHELLKLGGFNLRKWVSNCPDVLKNLPGNENSEPVKVLDKNSIPLDRALGMEWDTQEDTLGYNVIVKNQPMTRRGILSVTSSTYDPLGFAGPFLLPAKNVLQDLCKMKMGWDDKVTGEPLYRWQKWLLDLPKLSLFKIPRCLKPIDFSSYENRLHHFCDASQSGYGAVSYLRQVSVDGQIHCAILMSKSRVAPLKAVSIPRLELCAALLAVNLDQVIKNELEMELKDSVFWTDSTSVLKYIENTEKRFEVFVANRISKIKDASQTEQWHYVNTKQNPADFASRGIGASALMTSNWLTGPEFLWENEEHWPIQPPADIRQLSETDPEIKSETTVCGSVKEDASIDELFQRFSRWEKLKKCIAWIIRFKSNLQRAVKSKEKTIDRDIKQILPLSVDEIKMAELAIFSHVQQRYFPAEFQDAKESNKTEFEVRKASRIGKLRPIYKNGLLCVGGRLSLSKFSEESKHPIILPNNCFVTKLLIKYFHDLSGHCGREYVLSQMRKQYWVLKGSQCVRSVLKDCHFCKRHFSKRGTQIMADLPACRVESDKPPFSNTGVDCFGPFIVKRGRSNVKRYGIIFTCLAIRAIHIEVVHSLDTSSFLNALRRFIARRGPPEIIISDNGGNFVCGEAELKRAINDWNQFQIHEFLLQKNIRWQFNPPAASHHGGVWERCIRTVRKVLIGLLCQQQLDDESLMTLMCEVEAIINNRPITKLSSDPNDLDTLTPNHLLLMREGPKMPPGLFSREDIYSKRRWRQVQFLADQFWQRWRKEYLPMLQERQKWNKETRNFAVGDLVLVVDENLPRSQWCKGVVNKTFPDRRGIVRQVELKTATGFLRRDIRKLCMLEHFENL